MENKIICPRCGKEEIWKAGRPRGKQQYQCKNCRRKFITELNYSEEFKREAIQIFYEGNSERAIGRIKGINKSKGLLEAHDFSRVRLHTSVNYEDLMAFKKELMR